MLIVIFKYLKNLPDKYIFCLTALLLPLSFGVSKQLSQTEDISFQHGETKFKLGQIKEVAKRSDLKVEELIYQNQQLIESYNELKSKVSQHQELKPQIEKVDRAIEKSENTTNELANTSEDLQELTEKVVEEVTDVEVKEQSKIRRWLSARI